MTDLRDQLRIYFDALTDDVLGDEIVPTTSPQRGRHRTAWIVATAAVVAVAVIAGLLVLTRGSRDDAVHVAGVDRTVERQPTPASTAVPATWTRMDTAPGLFPNGASVTSVVAFGNRLIAAGNVYGTNVAVANPVVWTSTDGGRWERTWDAGTMVGGSSANPHLDVVGGAVWLLHSGTPGTTLWRSTDGLTWQPVSLPGAMAAVSVFDVADRDGVVVALSGDKFGRGDVLWRSEDGGVNWERVGPTLGPDAFPSSVVATDEGFVVAGLDTASAEPTVWTSTDGRAWAATHLSTTRGQAFSVTTMQNGTTVVEGTADNRPTAWYRDGDRWRQVDSYRATSVTAAPTTRLLSLGNALVSVDARPDALRYSRDGRTWTDVASSTAPDGTILAAGTSRNDLIVFVGQDTATGTSEFQPYRVTFPVAGRSS